MQDKLEAIIEAVLAEAEHEMRGLAEIQDAATRTSYVPAVGCMLVNWQTAIRDAGDGDPVDQAMLKLQAWFIEAIAGNPQGVNPPPPNRIRVIKADQQMTISDVGGFQVMLDKVDGEQQKIGGLQPNQLRAIEFAKTCQAIANPEIVREVYVKIVRSY